MLLKPRTGSNISFSRSSSKVTPDSELEFDFVLYSPKFIKGSLRDLFCSKIITIELALDSFKGIEDLFCSEIITIGLALDSFKRIEDLFCSEIITKGFFCSKIVTIRLALGSFKND